MTTIFEVLADPTRRRILDLLREKPRLVGELVDIIGISQPGISKQLRMLREMDLVRVRPDAQRHWYELNAAPLSEVDNWLANYRDQLDARYRRLDDLLDRLQREEKE